MRVSPSQSEARKPDPGAGLELRQLNRLRGGVAVEKVRGGESGERAGRSGDPGGRGCSGGMWTAAGG